MSEPVDGDIHTHTLTQASEEEETASSPSSPGGLEAARAIFETFKERRTPTKTHTHTHVHTHQQGKWTVAVWNAWMSALAQKGDLVGVHAALEGMYVCVCVCMCM